MTPKFARLAAAALVIVLVLAGCSSGTAASPSAATPTAAAPASAASSSAEASTGTTVGAAGDACALLPIADAQAALSLTGMTATPVPGDETSYCTFKTADGKDFAALSYSKSGGALVDAAKTAPGAVVIPGVADGAVLAGGLVYVKKGDAFAGFQLNSTENLSPDQLKQIATAIATSIGAHM
jgi:hypothetical protein